MRTAKDRARAHVAYRLRIGAIRRPDQCQECGSMVNLEAHHPDYGNFDRVQWLCRACHAAKRRRRVQDAAALVAGVAMIAVLVVGCSAFDTWAAEQEAAGVDVPAVINDVMGTGSVFLPSPWREILIGAAGIVGIVYQTITKRKLKRELSGV